MPKNEEDETFDAYITKYALSSGIQLRRVETNKSISANMVTDVHEIYVHFHKNEWFRTFEEAVANAEERRFKKLQSLERQKAKLAKLKFENPLKVS